MKKVGRRFLIVAATLVVGVAGLLVWRLNRWEDNSAQGETQDIPPTIPVAVPYQDLDQDYTTSATCQKCHPQQHASWHKSYHRSMTQLASADAVVAPFDGRVLKSPSGVFRFVLDLGDYYVERIDPLLVASIQKGGGDPRQLSDAPRIRSPIVMTTGSHHMQTYWTPAGFGNELEQVPWYYHIEERRWIPA
ncbi:MAG: hypothetical protein KDA84_21900, partial [Planctomycetaceae bacterium]|nr:hypothetical protein [Planctomycetaceae bacterium]